ncbi:hypothetical protein [Streptomyces sp. NBC_01497]|uniref:hypothetical protein n=1 Tax=Streptomyces sp. NBC_01497 TaxID=2903885 RepID=UPI002E37D2F7|nr:hypothetical protein [Streptomyces sp. NBC_01497]
MSGHGGGKPVAGKTDFDSMSHEQMYALLKSADMHTVSNLSEKLASVAKMVNKIGGDLKGHVMALEWEGKGGEAFREWGNQTANATLKLGEYADSAGKWMGEVSHHIVEAHSNMPALSLTTGAKSDLHLATEHMKKSDSPSFEKSAMLASSRIEGTRSDAAAQMQKLTTSYVHAGTQINALKPPTFPPPASQLGTGWVDPHPHVATPGQASPVVPGGGSSAAFVGKHPADSSESATASYVIPSGGHHVTGNSAIPVSGNHGLPEAHMEIDSVTPTAAPPGSPGSFGQAPVQDGPKSPASGFLPPAFGGPGAGPLSYNGTRGGESFGGRPGGGSGGRLPRLSLPGEFSEGGTSAGARGALPRPNGIVGGRPIQSSNGQPPSRLPRGTVVGGEEGASSRPTTGRGMPGMRMGGGSETGAARNGLVGGRRLASEPGGVVGRPGQAGRMGSRPFSQGGTGLVRGGSGEAEDSAGRKPGQIGRSGGTPPGGRSPRRRENEGADDRPDYLTEDDETWQQGNRRIVPPVID